MSSHQRPVDPMSGYFPCFANGCNGWFVRREGRFGVFYGCSRFPGCRMTRTFDSVHSEYTAKEIGEFDPDEPGFGN